MGNYTHKKKPKPIDKSKPKNQLKQLLGLNRPPKDVLSYADAMKLNELWMSYMKKVVNFDELCNKGYFRICMYLFPVTLYSYMINVC